MLVSIKARKFDVTPAMREYVEKRMEKFDKMLGGLEEIHVTVSAQKGTHKVEVTIPLHGTILRGEETGPDMYACVDKVVEKLERQVRKHKTRLAKRFREGSSIRFAIQEMEELPNENKLVKSKKFDVKPFSVEEAIMQMELLGHAFFVFVNDETEKINVVYRRHDGDYGLLEPAE